RGGVGFPLAQPPPHVGVDRQPDGARHHLARLRLRNSFFLCLEILDARAAMRAALQHDGAADGLGHVRPPHAAADLSTSRPVTLPSRNRISASLAWLCGTVATGRACSEPSCESWMSSRNSLGLPT